MKKITEKLFLEILKSVAPPKKMTISQWADENRILSAEGSAEKGKWNTDRAPYQREIMDSINEAGVEKVVIMSAIQVGKTEFLLNIVGYFIDGEPSPMMYVLPRLEDCKDFSKTRISTMARDTECLSSKISDEKTRDGKNNILMKMFPGGYIKLAGANSEASLRSAPLRVVLLDEVDAYPKSAGEGGDPSKLADGRTSNFYNRKIVMVSSPLTKGDSRIEFEYESSSMGEWNHVCPECKELTPIDIDLINFSGEKTTMTCPNCGSVSDEFGWKRHTGKWVHKHPEIKKRGFHITSFSSPWVSWEKLRNEYLEAKLMQERKNSDTLMKVFYNTRLGLPWEEVIEMTNAKEVEGKREIYEAQVPDGVLCLTAGVDTQDDRLECEVVGWGEGEESWGIEYKVFYGDPGKSEVWKQLDDYLSSTFYYKNKQGIKISFTCIDSGGHYTSNVYKFTKAREYRRIFSIKGQGGIGKPLVPKLPSQVGECKAKLFTLGVDDGKEILMGRLRLYYIDGQSNEGYCHFPMGNDGEYIRGYTEEYFKGLVSEVYIEETTKRGTSRYWKKIYKRNEPLDIRNYNQAAIKLFNPSFEMLREKISSGSVRIKKKSIKVGKGVEL